MEKRESIRISPHDRVALGVLAAMAKYANFNPNILRAGYIFVTILFPVPAIIAYGIIYFAAPKDRRILE